MSSLKIIKVESQADLNRFIDVPWTIYAQDENWVPPLKGAIKKLLDKSKHPFWEFSDRVLFLALRGSKAVGRIAAIVDGNYNEFHNEKMGAWGFFECENDIEASSELFRNAEEWTRSKGMEFMRGPLNPSTNYEVGLLIKGFEYPPTIMMTYNPPYYLPLIEYAGYTKEKDLIALKLKKEDRATARVERLARRVRRNTSISIRPADKKNFSSEMEIIRDIYNSAWSKNWGFVPMTDAEINEMGRELVRIIDEDLIFFFCYDGQPVGVTLIVPDINPILKKLNGKLGLLGILKFLKYRKSIKGVRGMALGIKNTHQKLGLPLLAFDHLNKLWDVKPYEYVEFGWNLEDNQDINNFEIEVGCKIYKKYRIFRKDF
jgi:hypothetical protein